MICADFLAGANLDHGDPEMRQDPPDRCGSYQELRPRPAIAGSSGEAGGHEHRRFSLPHLQGNPKRWSVRVTGNYRITFGWSGENALHVDFEDYH